MGVNYRIATVLLLCVAVAAVAVTTLRAERRPAYAVIDITEVTDPEALKTLVANAPLGLSHFQGRYIIRSQDIIALEGSPPKRFVVIEFDSLESAQGWSKSGPAKEFRAVRDRATTSRSFIIEGIPRSH